MGKVFTVVSNDEITQDKKEFNARHPESMHKVYFHSEGELRSFARSLHFLVNTQNGMDVDDYVVGENSPVYSYLKDNIEGKSVLLVGTGTGREMTTARELGAVRVEGTTLGQRNVAFAKEVVGESPVLCDNHALPWDKETFDVVAGFQIMEHAFSPVVFLLECNRVLKTGGLICMETPPAKTTSLDSWLHHVICPTGRQMCYLLQKTGFKPVEFIPEKGEPGIDISDVSIDEEEVPYLDDPSVMVCVKAIKQDPITYERRDMLRYYHILAGNSFVY